MISSDYVGNTPLIKLSNNLYGKLESVNPGGSIKDRPVKYILDHAIENKLIKASDTIVEATSGNTGVSLAMLCAERGYNCLIIMPSDMSRERKELIKFFGAGLIEVDAGDFDSAIELKDKLVKERGYFPLNQFSSELNIQCHYETTYRELMIHLEYDLQLDPLDKLSAFIAGTGTGGTLMGVKKGFDEDFKVDAPKIVAVEPTESPVMSGGKKGLHGIQGIGDGSKFLVDLDKVDEIMTISTLEAKTRAMKLAREHGILVGISAGANVLASEKWIEKNKPTGVVFTILCDRGERYFSCF